LAIRTCIFCDAVHDASDFDDDWDIIGCPECDTEGGLMIEDSGLTERDLEYIRDDAIDQKRDAEVV